MYLYDHNHKGMYDYRLVQVKQRVAISGGGGLELR